MARTTSEAVAEIIEVDSAISMDPFIETASLVVTDNCLDSGYSDTKLELIERWLAAHFYAIRDQRAAMEKAGPVSEAKQYQVGLHFNQTIYGQQAMLLDTVGTLANLNNNVSKGKKKFTPSLLWLGKKRDEVVP